MRKAVQAVYILEEYDGDAEISSALLGGRRSSGGHQDNGKVSPEQVWASRIWIVVDTKECFLEQWAVR